MAEIQCPHCDKNIELEDGLSGIFDCPYCHNEFIWGNEKQTKQISNHHTNYHESMPLGFKIVRNDSRFNSTSNFWIFIFVNAF